MIEPTALPPAVPGSVSKPKRQTRSAASAHLGESIASTAQTSTARLIANSPLRFCFHLSTLYDMRNVCLGTLSGNGAARLIAGDRGIGDVWVHVGPGRKACHSDQLP